MWMNPTENAMPPTTALSDPALAMSEPIDSARIDCLARTHGRHVFLVAYRILGDPALAEDVQQDLFLRLMEKPPYEVDSWPAWLGTATTRLAIDRLRRTRRWHRLLAAFRMPEPAQPALPDNEASDAQRANWLRQALAALPRFQAHCFALRHIDGLEIPAIAQLLGISHNHVSVTLHRATQRLQQQRRAATDSKDT
jgi:RNA polymerase sigma factor (sigma-70 family)